MAPDVGTDATRRTRLANERTFLAWWRTGLATAGLALATGRLLPELVPGATWPYVALGAAFGLLAVAVMAFGWWRFAAVEHELHGGEAAAMPGWVAAVMGFAGTACALAITVLILTI